MWLADASLVVRHLYLVPIAMLMILMVMQKEAEAEEISERKVIGIHNQKNKKNESAALMRKRNAPDAKHFDPQFLHSVPGQAPADLSFFSYPNQVLPGTYLTDIYVNERYVEQIEMRFDNPVGVDSQSEAVSARACINKDMLERWGIDIMQFSVFNDIDNEDKQCLPLTEWIPHSQVHFNMA